MNIVFISEFEVKIIERNFERKIELHAQTAKTYRRASLF